MFIVSAPRSGSTLLFGLLCQSPDIWSIGGESHAIYEQFPHLTAEDSSFSSGRLTAVQADQETREQMRWMYLAYLKNNKGQALVDTLFSETQAQPTKSSPVFLEKTPRNALNIDFLQAVFPRAKYIYLHRDPRENISSIMEGWQRGAKTGEFVRFVNLPDWPMGYWCFLLPPGWQALKGKPLHDIAAFQWRACNDIILQDLSLLPDDSWTSVSYADLVATPSETLKRLCAFCAAESGEYIQSRSSNNLPLSASTVTPPKKDKWKRHQKEIEAVLPSLSETIALIESRCASPVLSEL